MAFYERVSLLMGLAAITAVGSALPAQANVNQPQNVELLTADAIDIEFSNLMTEQPIDLADQSVGLETEVETASTPTSSASTAAIEAAVSQTDPQVSTSAAALLDPQADGTSLLSFDTARIDAVMESATVDVAQASGEQPIDLAQLTRGNYGGVAPIYVGVGGNLGVGDEDDTAIADFGFTIISKVALGPRFALRPSVIFSGERTSFLVPITYNFNVQELGDFRFQPYAGAGVDLSSGAGLLLNAGADLPVSRDFTINAVTNWRVTDGFGFGLTVGVGYNFPFVFE